MVTQQQESLISGLRLEERFPGVRFSALPHQDDDGSVVIPVIWPETGPKSGTVAAYIRSVRPGLPVVPTSDHTLEIRLSPEMLRNTRKNPQRRTSAKPRASRKAQPTPVRAHFWDLSDLEALRESGVRWVATLNNPGVIKTYLLMTTLMTLIAGFGTYAFDIHPSLVFAQHLADSFAEVSTWLDPNLVMIAVALFSITPNLMEFAGAGLAAHGNIVIAFSVMGALIFDAITDSPAAYAFASAFATYFLPVLTGIGHTVVSGILALPVLLFITAGLEIVFFTFAIATFLLFRRLQALPKRTR